MIDIQHFLRSESGKNVVSVVLGLGLASLFYKVCNDKQCVTFISPTKKDMENTYRYNDKCYKFDMKGETCSSHKRTVHHV
jgi:hypothetical protein